MSLRTNVFTSRLAEFTLSAAEGLARRILFFDKLRTLLEKYCSSEAEGRVENFTCDDK